MSNEKEPNTADEKEPSTAESIFGFIMFCALIIYCVGQVRSCTEKTNSSDNKETPSISSNEPTSSLNEWKEDRKKENILINNNCKLFFNALSDAFATNSYGKKSEKPILKAISYEIKDDYSNFTQPCVITVQNIHSFASISSLYGRAKAKDTDNITHSLLVHEKLSLDPQDKGYIKIYRTELIKAPYTEMKIYPNDYDKTFIGLEYYGQVPTEYSR